MSEAEVKQANQILAAIKELEKAIHNGDVTIEAKQNWGFGCGVEPHKMEMLYALDDARAAAHAVMESAANRQIRALKQKLQAMGVKTC